MCRVALWLRNSLSATNPVVIGTAALLVPFTAKSNHSDHKDQKIMSTHELQRLQHPLVTLHCLAASLVKCSQNTHPHQDSFLPGKDRDVVHLAREVQQSFK